MLKGFEQLYHETSSGNAFDVKTLKLIYDNCRN